MGSAAEASASCEGSMRVADVPGCYIRFGAQVPGRESFPAHSGRFDFDEAALATGAAWFAEVAQRAGRVLADGVSK